MKVYRLSSDNALSINSSGGKLLKWKTDKGFIKTSTFDNTGLAPRFLYESYAEYIAYRIAKYLGLNAIKYRLCKVIINDKIFTVACESDDFVPAGYKYVSIAKLTLMGVIPKYYIGDDGAFIDIAERLNGVADYKTHIANMLYFDALILNDDRHYGNFGILTNGVNTIPAPIFDNGNSLFCHKNLNGITYSSDLIQYLKSKPFSIYFDRQLELVSKYTSNIDVNRINEAVINRILYDTVNKYEMPISIADFIHDLIVDRVNVLKMR